MGAPCPQKDTPQRFSPKQNLAQNVACGTSQLPAPRGKGSRGYPTRSANLIAVQNTCARQIASAHTHTHFLAPHKRTGAPWTSASACHRGGGWTAQKKCRGEDHVCAPTCIAAPGCAAEQRPHHEDSLRRRQNTRAHKNTHQKQNDCLKLGSHGQELDASAQQAQPAGSLRASEADCATACC